MTDISFAGAPQRIKCCQMAANAFLSFLIASQLYTTTNRTPFKGYTTNMEVGIVISFFLILLDTSLYLGRGFSLYKHSLCGAFWIFTLICVCFTQVTFLTALNIPKLGFLYYEYSLLFVTGASAEGALRLILFYRRRTWYIDSPRLRLEDLLAMLQCPASLYKTTLKEETCAICLDRLQDLKKVVRLPCGEKQNHYFHTSCFSHWLERSNQCPLCRGTNFLNVLRRKKSNSKKVSPLPY